MRVGRTTSLLFNTRSLPKITKNFAENKSNLFWVSTDTRTAPTTCHTTTTAHRNYYDYYYTSFVIPWRKESRMENKNLRQIDRQNFGSRMKCVTCLVCGCRHCHWEFGNFANGEIYACAWHAYVCLPNPHFTRTHHKH